MVCGRHQPKIVCGSRTRMWNIWNSFQWLPAVVGKPSWHQCQHSPPSIHECYIYIVDLVFIFINHQSMYSTREHMYTNTSKNIYIIYIYMRICAHCTVSSTHCAQLPTNRAVKIHCRISAFPALSMSICAPWQCEWASVYIHHTA